MPKITSPRNLYIRHMVDMTNPHPHNTSISLFRVNKLRRRSEVAGDRRSPERLEHWRRRRNS
ncbi:hypothetical protein HanIR_Chr12g0613461 [Helianthus annuus]|nr:hypothetical protein HanIR_Chr12g0613461 [Helianthus annuus]